jgi:hypothetical protein
LYALHDLGTALGFMSVLDFFGDFVLLEHRRNGHNARVFRKTLPFINELEGCVSVYESFDKSC